MQRKNSTIIFGLFLIAVFILQSHSDGRAIRNRDNTGAPGGQMGGNGGSITCSNCHDNATFEVGLNFELLDSDSNPVTTYRANERYTAKVLVETNSGDMPNGYGFQMVSLLDTDNSDINGWIDNAFSPNVQLVLANSTGRVYAEHHSLSATNEFTADWEAPDINSGDVSFYIAGIGANGNGASSGDHATSLIKVTIPELLTTSTTDSNLETTFNIYPNPISNNLNIAGDIKNKIIQIYSQSGMAVSMISQKDVEVIDLTNLPSGIYFVAIKNLENKYISTKIFVKE